MPMNAEALERVKFPMGVKEENLPKTVRKNELEDTGNGIEG